MIESLQGKRIFIFDDNPANMAIAKMLLERHGVVVWFDRWGDNVEERLIKFAPVDLILLDLMLYHNLSGFDLVPKIRAVPDFEQIPIVAYSASNPNEAIPKAKAMGLAGYIAKPIDYDAFPYQVDQILKGEPVWLTK